MTNLLLPRKTFIKNSNMGNTQVLKNFYNVRSSKNNVAGLFSIKGKVVDLRPVSYFVGRSRQEIDALFNFMIANLDVNL